MKIIELTDELKPIYNERLIKFERSFSYPIGQDNFSIDHGKNYYTFFDRIGKPYFFVALLEDQVIGVACGVLRSGLCDHDKIWYICDLKIDSKYRGSGIVYEFLYFAFKKYSYISTKIYGISMDGQASAKVLNFIQHTPLLNLKFKDTLYFYLLNRNEMHSYGYEILDQHVREYYFISLSGIKDIILDSTLLPINMLHLKLGYEPTIVKDCKYMMCFPKLHPVSIGLKAQGIAHMATASIFSNFQHEDWSFITSNEI
ncbi:putative GNAT family N-acetyltransferase [Candidatus Cyrtobacter comes]|uniref:GNAT family N-acetyltransferase n=1 Tax=Candidatus Cyrtobacter comes TaxID=675776 RepID=A0ABU5L9J8_9RICK|nr:GNAT family N-acetyltransferase [Candidatus Cyrtobacter comes]MDZ5762799.1 putative GNAT family N-acetyltransferase [Candidatus Cyrtobacter comes]